MAEASWLAAVVVAPLYVDVSFQHPFEVTKAAAIRTLAVLAAVGFVVGAVAGRRRDGWPSSITRPVGVWLAAAGVLAGSHVVSTSASLAPVTSLAGSHHRNQGLVTLFGYLVLGAVAAASIRRREQVDRALSAMVLAAVPVAAAAVAEQHGWMVLPRLEPPPRAASTLGNPMALGGYLLFALPLAVARLVEAQAAGPAGPDPRRRMLVTATTVACAVGWTVGGPWAGAAVSAVAVTGVWATGGPHRSARARSTAEGAVVGLLVAAVLAAGSRGAAVGLVGGVIVAVAVAGPRWWSRPRHLSRCVCGVLAAVALGALLVRLAGERVPLFGRVAEPLQGEGTTAGVRITLWRTALDAVRSGHPLTSPAGPDRLHRLRPLVGHGQETTDLVIGPFAPPELWRYEDGTVVPDRLHGAALELLVQNGALGLAAHLAVLTIAVLVGLRSLGLLPRGPAPFLACWSGGAAGLVALAAAAGRPELTGVALAAGMAIGLVVHVVLVRSRAGGADGAGAATTSVGPVSTPVVVAALAGVVGHWLELQFGFGWVATSTYSWFALGLLVVSSRGSPPVETDHPPWSAAPERWLVVPFAGLAVALTAFAASHGDRGAQVWVVAAAGTGAVLVLRPVAPARSAPWSRAAAGTIVTAAALVAAGRLALGQGVVRFAAPEEWRPVVLISALVLLVVAAGTLTSGPFGRLRARDATLVVVAGAAGMAALWPLALAPAQAEVLRRQAGLVADPVEALALFERAHRLEPLGHRPTARDATRYGRAAVAADRPALLDAGLVHLGAAQRRSPFDAELAIGLASLHEQRAELARSTTARAAALDAAIRHHGEAVRLRPAAAHLRARLALTLIRRSEVPSPSPHWSDTELRIRAERELHRAAQLHPDLVLVTSVRARSAERWPDALAGASSALERLARGGSPAGPHDRQARELALEALDRADSRAIASGQGPMFAEHLAHEANRRRVPDLYRALAEAHGRRGDPVEGLAALNLALELSPPDDLIGRDAYRRVEAALRGYDAHGPLIDLQRAED